MATLLILGMAALGVWLLYTERELIRKGLASYRWLPIEGTIVDSEDDSFTTAGISRWNAGVVPVTYTETKHAFVYVVGGRAYRSTTFCFGAHAELATAAYLIGTKVKVYYDPKDPQNSVLKRGVQPSMYIGPVLIIAAAFMALAFVF